ncbi:carbohydrate sulfotransferase 15-like [Dysidea avara]|uniref:carbohydrate sulfotransferase 15-like n=1 Tax=Dysidea avara TaxID=196820 RepID=UPI00332DFE2A
MSKVPFRSILLTTVVPFIVLVALWEWSEKSPHITQLVSFQQYKLQDVVHAKSDDVASEDVLGDHKILDVYMSTSRDHDRENHSEAKKKSLVDTESHDIMLDITSSDYSKVILNHELPNCRKRTIHNGKSNYSLPDILAMVRKVIPPPDEFVSNLKNPCWYADYGPVKAEVNWIRNVDFTKDSVPGTKSLHCLPYMYLLGYPKCGSTTFYSSTIRHPESIGAVQGYGWLGRHSAGLVKGYEEAIKTVLDSVEYFIRPTSVIESESTKSSYYNGIFSDFAQDTSWLRHGFDGVADGSLCDPPLLLKEIQPNAKFVVLMREPISRQYSAFWYTSGKLKPYLIANDGPSIFADSTDKFFSRLKQCSSSQSMIHCIRDAGKFHSYYNAKEQIYASFYYVYLLPWLQVFPRKNFLFIRTEDMAKDTVGVLKQVFKFLEMSPLPEDTLQHIFQQNTGNRNQTYIHKNANLQLSSSTKKHLRAYYRPFNEKLAELLKDDKFLWDDITD